MAFRRVTSQLSSAFGGVRPTNENVALPTTKKRTAVEESTVAAKKTTAMAGGLRVRDINVAPVDDGKKKLGLKKEAPLAAGQLLAGIAPPPAAQAPVFHDESDCGVPMDTAEDGAAAGADLAVLEAAHLLLGGPLAARALPAGVVDIDATEGDNPQMAADYIHEIDAYMRMLEAKQAPSGMYMEAIQKDLRVDMRGILVDWLVEVHQRFKLIQETLFLTIHILDRYLSVQPVSRNKLQLIGVCSMLIASKYEEMFPPEVQDFIWVSRNAYTRADIITTEGLILRALDFDLGTPLPLHFLRRNSRAADSTPHVHNTAKYFMEVAVANYSMLGFLPSQLAAASLYCAREALGEAAVWTPTTAFYAGYTEAALAPCVAALRLCLGQAERTLPAVHKKFSDAKVFNASGRPEVLAYIAQHADADSNMAL